MTHHQDAQAVPDGAGDTGMLPSQWIVRILGLALLGLALAALVGSREGIQRYVKMSRM
jgi:hypothetical protein